ncbi:MAG TPA: hypothetical protein VLH09_11085 [Bryobacteraceae bacterium]|nr:hypothetical protein [Bryobacteraceae bacterium]
MKNWKRIAAAMETGLSDADADRIAPTLDALEAALRPLIGAIPHEAEPAVIFEPPPEELP